MVFIRNVLSFIQSRNDMVVNLRGYEGTPFIFYDLFF